MKKILIIDDEPVILMTLRDRLIQQKYDVETAATGADGIAKTKSYKPEIVILDIMLPDMNGHEVCKKIKDEFGEEIKIVMATSKIDAVDAAKAVESGADEFTVKTTDYAVLMEALKKVL